MSFQIKNFSLFALLAISIILFSNCKKNNLEEPEETTGIPEVKYVATIPGKSPLPHHNPNMTQQEVDQLTEDLFIINNFGQYQCGDEVSRCYFHNALDVVLVNGTEIFALEDGVVRAELGGNEFYRTLYIESKTLQNHGWTYTHVYDFEVEPGDIVVKGQKLGVVNFQGVDHIHLGRVRIKEGGNPWNYSDYIFLYPDDFFAFKDDAPPVIEKPFLFFENGSDIQLNQGDTKSISGKVDIVVRMRDEGQYTHGHIAHDGELLTQSPKYGQRLCLQKITYRILKDGEEMAAFESFNLPKLEFQRFEETWLEVNNMYKFHKLVDPNHEQSSWDKFLSPYIITNVPSGFRGQMRTKLGDESYWDTTATDENGDPIYPNGLYEIEVTAYDANQNKTVVSDQVMVEN